MSGRDERIYDEAVALWRELYDEPPPASADGAMLLRAITSGLPFQTYDRMSSVHLRPTTISGRGQHQT